jgi:hypothetical protein
MSWSLLYLIIAHNYTGSILPRFQQLGFAHGLKLSVALLTGFVFVS